MLCNLVLWHVQCLSYEHFSDLEALRSIHNAIEKDKTNCSWAAFFQLYKVYKNSDRVKINCSAVVDRQTAVVEYPGFKSH